MESCLRKICGNAESYLHPRVDRWVAGLLAGAKGLSSSLA